MPVVRTLRRQPAGRYVAVRDSPAVLHPAAAVAGQYWNYTIGTVGIYVLLGLGLNIVVGLAGLLDLGYVAFFAIGAYTVALLTAPAAAQPDVELLAGLPIGILLAALTGMLLGIPVLRMRGDYLAIVDARVRRDHPHPEQERRADRLHRRAARRARGRRPDLLRIGRSTTTSTSST